MNCFAIKYFEFLVDSNLVDTFAKLYRAAPMVPPLKEVIRLGEGTQVEFKKTLPQLEKIAKTLVSFANSHGGILIVGVQDDKVVTGITDIEEQLYVLEKANVFYCKPSVPIRFHEEDIYGKIVLVIEVEESQNKPHRALSQQGDWAVYVRDRDQCVLASNLVIKVLETQQEEKKIKNPNPLTNNEKALFGFLERQNKITLKDYAKLINVSKRRAYRILIDLTLKGKLFMHDFDNSLFFTKS